MYDSFPYLLVFKIMSWFTNIPYTYFYIIQTYRSKHLWCILNHFIILSMLKISIIDVHCLFGLTPKFFWTLVVLESFLATWYGKVHQITLYNFFSRPETRHFSRTSDSFQWRIVCGDHQLGAKSVHCEWVRHLLSGFLVFRVRKYFYF